ncbi:protein-export chaperone SecB [Streptomyces sp. C]|uniref:protein-export chaperone SecB n=1 Tax=Streptomyces sp. C TaxID=253839 RepID=UPI0001B55762|nr:protein-export chaperone SecB [Streptomyces sp. C]
MNDSTKAELLKGAARLHRSAELGGVLLESVEARAPGRHLDPPFTVEIAIESSYSAPMEGKLAYTFRYDVQAKSDDKIVMQVKALYRVKYSFDLEDVPEDVIEAYGENVALATVHPYVRELVRRISGDFGFPPLTLDNLDLSTLFAMFAEGL